jgi:hypothetical protein
MNDFNLASPLTSSSNFSSRWLRASPLLVALALGTAGCEVRTRGDDYVGDDAGTLRVRWSLDDSFDPGACDDFDAYDLELVISDDRGRTVSNITEACDSFSTDIDLPDGVYSVDATLLDRSGHDVSTTLSLDNIDVYAGEDTPLEIDFPIDSQR